MNYDIRRMPWYSKKRDVFKYEKLLKVSIILRVIGFLLVN